MSSGGQPWSLSKILHWRATCQPTRLAFRFLRDGTSDEIVDWTYRDLADHSAVVAAGLRRLQPRARRVMLALDPGLHYVAALFGIFQAGATAVPAFPPTGKRAMSRFQSIVLDCAPDAAIADPRLAKRVDQIEVELPDDINHPQWIFADGDFFSGAGNADLAPTVAEPALLQYTSGSTGDPKGIVISPRQPRQQLPHPRGEHGPRARPGRVLVAAALPRHGSDGHDHAGAAWRLAAGHDVPGALRAAARTGGSRPSPTTG